MKLAPYPAPASTMLSDFPFAFPEDFQAGTVNDKVRDFTPCWGFYADTDGL